MATCTCTRRAEHKPVLASASREKRALPSSMRNAGPSNLLPIGTTVRRSPSCGAEEPGSFASAAKTARLFHCAMWSMHQLEPLPFRTPRVARAVVSRLRLLASIPARLLSVRNERELAAKTEASLRALFPRARGIMPLRTNASRDAFVRPTPAAGCAELLGRLCKSLPPRPKLGRFSLAQLLPCLAVPNLLFADSAIDCGALAAVPLLHQTTFLGLLTIELEPDAPDFTVPDLDEISSPARPLPRMDAPAHERRDDSKRQQRAARDLGLAREIQRRFLPASTDETPGFRIAAEYHPAYEIGGDFYDVIPTGDGRIVAVIADVSGKGVPAALLMSRFSSDFRRLARTGLSVSALMGELNQLLCEQTTDEEFVTAVCLCLRTRAHRGGERRPRAPAPAAPTRPGGSAGEVSGPPLGMILGQRYEQKEFTFSTGDIVVMMTDGVVEALDSDADRLGSWALTKLLAGAPPIIGRSTGASSQPSAVAPKTAPTMSRFSRSKPWTGRNSSRPESGSETWPMGAFGASDGLPSASAGGLGQKQ